MSKNRHHPIDPSEPSSCRGPGPRWGRVFPGFHGLSRVGWGAAAVLASWLLVGNWNSAANGTEGATSTANESVDGTESGATEPGGAVPSGEEAERAHRAARVLVNSMIEHLAYGPPFEAKVRVRAWAAGTEVLEIGTYRQSGQGKGWMNMDLQVPIADGKGRWQQTCDGRLVWTREELAGEVRVRRVDVGRLRELLGGNRGTSVPAWFRVGGLAEILDSVLADFELTIAKGHIEEQPMVIIKGDSMIADSPEELAPELRPRHVVIAVPIAALENPVPARIEYWTRAGGRLLGMLEVYDKNIIEPPTIDEFRFETGGGDFVNETDRYLLKFGFSLAEGMSAEKK